MEAMPRKAASALMAIAFLALLASGCSFRNLKHYGNLRSFQYNTVQIFRLSPDDTGQLYTVFPHGDKVLLHLVNFPFSDRLVSVDSEALSQVQRLIEQEGLIAWDGFNKHNKAILDGSSWGLTAQYESGAITAQGVNAWPRNFEQKISSITEYLDVIGEEAPPYLPADNIQALEIPYRQKDGSIISCHIDFQDEIIWPVIGLVGSSSDKIAFSGLDTDTLNHIKREMAELYMQMYEQPIDTQNDWSALSITSQFGDTAVSIRIRNGQMAEMLKPVYELLKKLLGSDLPINEPF